MPHHSCLVCQTRLPSNIPKKNLRRVSAPSFKDKFLTYISDNQLDVIPTDDSFVCTKHYGIIIKWSTSEHLEIENHASLDVEARALIHEGSASQESHCSLEDQNVREFDALSASTLVDIANFPDLASQILSSISHNKKIAVQVLEIVATDASLSSKVLEYANCSSHKASQPMIDSQISLGQSSCGQRSQSQIVDNEFQAPDSDWIESQRLQSQGREFSLESESLVMESKSQGCQSQGVEFPLLESQRLEFQGLKSQELESQSLRMEFQRESQSQRMESQEFQSQHTIPALSDHSYSQGSSLQNSMPSQASSTSLGSGTQRSSQSARSYFLAKGVKCARVSENVCFICGKATRYRVPKDAKKQVWMEKLILIPENNRCCLSHRTSDNYFTADALLKIEAAHENTYMTAQDLGDFLIELTESRKSHLAIDFRDANMTEKDYKLLTGFGKKVFTTLLSYIEHRINNTENRHKKNALGMFLMAMRMNLTQSVLAHLFKTSQPTVSHAIESVSDALEQEFVPKFLGRQCLSRDEAVNAHSRQIVKKLFDAEGKLVEIWDGTYIYIEAPGDNDLQRNFYSGQKKRHLIKIMISCLSSGRIVEVSGAYTANSNDATIQALMMHENEEIRNYYKEGDIIIVDRGFRDSVSLMKDYGLQVFTPTDAGGNRPFTTKEANMTRRVTLVRWLIEAVNGRLKNLFRFFSGSAIEAGYMKQIPKFVRICCALINAFCPPLLEDKPEHEFIGSQVLNLINRSNDLYDLIKDEHLMPRITKKFEKLTVNSISEFPKLTWEELLGLTLGVYQLRRADKYNKEHIQENPEYELYYYLIQKSPILIRARLQSRHINRTKYDIFVKADSTKTGLDAIVGWWCSCKSGARVVGCCSHVAAIIRFLSYDCHQPIPLNARKRICMEYVNANIECKNKGIQMGKKRKKNSDLAENADIVESESDSEEEVQFVGHLFDSEELLDV